MSGYISDFYGAETGDLIETLQITGSPFTTGTYTRTSGGYSYELNSNSEKINLSLSRPATANGRKRVIGFAFYIQTLTGGTNQAIMQMEDNTSIFTPYISISYNGGDIRLRLQTATGAQNGPTTVTNNEWHTVELVYEEATASGSLILYLDGSEEFNLTGQDTTTGSYANQIAFKGLNSAGGFNVDDIYVKELVDSVSASEFLGGPIVRAYQNDTVTGTTPDRGILQSGTLDTGTWANIGETPLTTANSAAYTSSGPLGGVVHTESGNTRAGPAADTAVDNLVAASKYVFHAERGNGGGTTHYIFTGHTGMIYDEEFIDTAQLITLETSPTTFTYSARLGEVAVPCPGQPTTSDNSLGLEADNGIWLTGAQSATEYEIHKSTDDGLTWTKKHTTFGAEVRSFAYNGSKWVAVGDSGKWATSDNNGDSWTDQTTFTTAQLGNVIWDAGNSLFIAASSSNGELWTSPTGNAGSWTSRTSNMTATYCMATDGNGETILGGPDAERARSTNGTTWTQTTDTLFGTGQHCMGLAYCDRDDHFWASFRGTASLGRFSTNFDSWAAFATPFDGDNADDLLYDSATQRWVLFGTMFSTGKTIIWSDNPTGGSAAWNWDIYEAKYLGRPACDGKGTIIWCNDSGSAYGEMWFITGNKAGPSVDDSFSFGFGIDGARDFTMYDMWAMVLHIPSAGATTPQSVAGSITPTGDAVPRANKSLNGSINASGDIALQIALTMAGVITATGSLLKKAITTFTGSITGSGILSSTKVVMQAVTGAITATGALAKGISHQVVGSITGSGALTNIKSFVRTVAGTITATGSLIKQTSKKFGNYLNILGLGGISGFKAGITDSIANINNSSDFTVSTGTVTFGENQLQIGPDAVGSQVYPSNWPDGQSGETVTCAIHITAITGTIYVGCGGTSEALTTTGWHVFDVTTINPASPLIICLSGSNTATIDYWSTSVKSTSLLKQISKQLAGSITGSGVISTVKVVLQALAGTITATGSLIKQTGKNVIGSITGSGSLVKDIAKIVVGSITKTGSLATQFIAGTIQQAVGGVITATGAITKQAQKIVSGSSTGTGALTTVRTIAQLVVGSITATGALIRDIGKAVAGNITGSGAIIKDSQVTRVGSITGSGTVSSIKVFLQACAGVITATGSLIKQTSKNVIGSITTTGALTKLSSFFRTVSGSITATGSTFKNTFKTFTGSITGAGALATIKVFLQACAGAITAAGALSKSTLKKVAGSITSSGSIVKDIAKNVVGSITGVGSLIADKIGAFTQLCSGTITASGTIVKDTATSMAGSITALGHPYKEMYESVTGSITGTGVLSTTKVILQLVSGSITATGSILKTIGKNVAGSITKTGSLVTQFIAGTIQQAVGGVITAVGNITKSTSVKRVGSILPSGHVFKTMYQSLVGSITGSGALTRIKGAFLLLTGSITATGSIVKKISITPSGVITLTGHAYKLISKLVTGTISAIGNLISKFLSSVPRKNVPLSMIVDYPEHTIDIKYSRDLEIT